MMGWWTNLLLLVVVDVAFVNPGGDHGQTLRSTGWFPPA
jgi:hypothetical protein